MHNVKFFKLKEIDTLFSYFKSSEFTLRTYVSVNDERAQMNLDYLLLSFLETLGWSYLLTSSRSRSSRPSL